LRDTQALTAEEHGVYFLLLMHYWQKKGDIGADIKRLAIVARSDEKTTKTILDSFFILGDDGYKNKRADEELTAAKTRSDTARANIQKRWNKGGNTAVIRAYNGGNTAGGTESIRNGYSSPSSSPSQEEKKEGEREEGVSKLDTPRIQNVSKRFVKPTVTEIQAYCLSRKNNVNAQRFFDSYESKDWMIGKNRMKDWRAAVRTWENNDFSGFGGNGNGKIKAVERATMLEMEE